MEPQEWDYNEDGVWSPLGVYYCYCELPVFMAENIELDYHVNIGKFKLPDGKFFQTGLPKGFPDLHLIGKGWVAYVETKIHPRKPTPEQLEWLAVLNSRNIPAKCVYSLDEFIAFIEENGLL